MMFLQQSKDWDELDEEYFRPESSQIGPAGSYSVGKSTYPVPRSALQEYLEHQPQESLTALMRRSAHRGLASRGRRPHQVDGDLQPTDAALPRKQAAVGRALSDYLQHQRQTTRARLERRTTRGRLRLLADAKQRSVAQQLALEILGEGTTNPQNRGTTAPPSSPSPASGRPAAVSVDPAREEKILHVVQLLQKEIALDTRAIGAFRQRLDRAGLAGPPASRPLNVSTPAAPAPAPAGVRESLRARAAGLEGRLAALRRRNAALVAAATDLARRRASAVHSPPNGRPE
jgi:hypothetical protein